MDLNNTMQADPMVANQSNMNNVDEPVHINDELEIFFKFQLKKQFHLGFIVLGILGNFLCIYVFKEKSLLKQKFNWYLLLQALSDLIFLKIIFITSIIKFFYNPQLELQDFHWLTCLLTDYIYESLNALGVLLTLIMSIDRLYAILRPFKIRSFITYRCPKRLALFTYLAVLFIKSPELYLNPPRYKPEAPFGHRCNWSIRRDDFNKKIFYIMDSRIFIPIGVIIIPALISFSLNIILWCFMCQYVQKSPRNLISKSRRPLFATSESRIIGDHVHTAACRSGNCEVLKHLKAIKASYHLTIIMLNVFDLPYYCFHLYFVCEAIFKWRRFIFETPNPVNNKMSKIFFTFFIFGHSINLVIYMLFHKEFRTCACKMLNRLNPICKISRSQSTSSDHFTVRTKSSPHEVDRIIDTPAKESSPSDKKNKAVKNSESGSPKLNQA